MNYHNENDPFAAQWLRNLIAAGLIPPGEVDERSIADVRASDLEGFTQCHFFAGIGGWPLALQLAGWPVTRPVWTGSCPCQPFSAAGKRKGFDDDRHLWPIFCELIAQRRPATVFGEQVAAAAQWLGLVRGDLEALDYAVGAIPVEAASAGADHLRDRFWFVGHLPGDGRGEVGGAFSSATGRGQGRGHAAGASEGAPGVALGDAYDTRSQGRASERERAGELSAGAARVAHAHAHVIGEGEGREQRSGQQRGAGGDQEACARDLSDTRGGSLRDARCAEAARPASSREGSDGERQRLRPDAGPICDGGFEWVIGADGKARRVKPGVRLLAHGVPNRVGKLRGFGNAIDPRPAAAFIKAASAEMSREV